jgi:hypothetical protein
MIEKMVSGEQTSLDFAPIDFAIELALPYGGWCPKGQIDEKGVISENITV